VKKMRHEIEMLRRELKGDLIERGGPEFNKRSGRA